MNPTMITPEMQASNGGASMSMFAHPFYYPLEGILGKAQELQSLLEVTQDHIGEADTFTLGNLTSIATRMAEMLAKDAQALIDKCRDAGKAAGGANHE